MKNLAYTTTSLCDGLVHCAIYKTDTFKIGKKEMRFADFRNVYIYSVSK